MCLADISEERGVECPFPKELNGAALTNGLEL